ncbi:hypothetical protein K439DRAFT_1648728 [Ramaria rubella]|nr:hypothetical protein K439DRAFT_1648728 [Ramaria rubella]
MLDDLLTCQEFIEAIQNVSLDNGDLDEEEVFTLDDEDELFLLKQYLATQRLSEETYNRIRVNHNKRYPNDPMLSFTQICKKCMTPNSCVTYTGPFLNLEACPKCETSRWDDFHLNHTSKKKKKKVPAQHFYTIPLAPQIQALWQSPESSQNLNYCWRGMQELLDIINSGNYERRTFTDLLDGDEYLEAMQRGHIKNNDTVVMFSIDGAQLYQDKQSDCWIYKWIMIDLDPDMRYKKNYVIPGGFVPGLNNPKHTDSFLFLGFHHLVVMQKEGLKVWDASDAQIKDSNIYIYIFLLARMADGPGSLHFTGLVGHHRKYPCRIFCRIKGRHKEALLLPYHYNVKGCTHGDIPLSDIQRPQELEYQTRLAYLLDSGISKPSLLFLISSTLSGHCMHLPTLNLGTFACEDTDDTKNWDWAVLKKDIWKQHGLDMGNCKLYLPYSYDCPPHNIALKINSGYNAKEWQGYFYGLGPALLHNILLKKYWQNFCKLRSIPLDHLQMAQRYLDEFHLEFEVLYVQHCANRLHFVQPCIHACLHLGLEVPRLGTPSMYLVWTMERTIGNLGEEIGQPSNPYHNLSERGLLHAQFNALKAIGAINVGEGYILQRLCDRTGLLIDTFFEQGLMDAGLDAIPGQHYKIMRYSSLHLPTGQLAQSLCKEIETPISRLQMLRCVKFYFHVQFSGEWKYMAMILLYSRPDMQLYQESYWTVYLVMQLLAQQGLHLIDVKSIVTMVSMQPHRHQVQQGEQRFFVWEYLGLDVALVGNGEVDGSENV